MNKRELVIFGCGGLGLEVLAYFKAALLAGSEAPVLRGFVDGGEPRSSDAQRLWQSELVFHRTLAELESTVTDFVITVGDPVMRESLYQSCVSHGLRSYSVIHPSAVICDGAQVDEGAVLAPFAFIGPGAHVKRNAVVNVYASVGHDASLGYSSVLSPYAILNGGASCGNLSLLGTHSSVLPMNRLGNFSKLAAGGILSSSTEDGSLAMGNPAKHRVLFRQPQISEST